MSAEKPRKRWLYTVFFLFSGLRNLEFYYSGGYLYDGFRKNIKFLDLMLEKPVLTGMIRIGIFALLLRTEARTVWDQTGYKDKEEHCGRLWFVMKGAGERKERPEEGEIPDNASFPEEDWDMLDSDGQNDRDLDSLKSFRDDAVQEDSEELDLYLVTADDKLRELGMEPCAFKWNKMSQEERREVYVRLVELRDQSEENFNLTADCAFLLNSKLVFKKCHQRCRGDHTVEAVQTAFSDFWEFAKLHWAKYDPGKSLFSSYLSMGFYKVSATTAMDVVKMSASKHYSMGLLARAESQIQQESGVERVDDVALRMKTGVTPTMIKQYRNYQQAMNPSELDANLKMTESFSAGKRHLKSPESVAQEDELIQKLTRKVELLVPRKGERRIAKMALGLTSYGEMTPKEIARLLHLSAPQVSAEWLRIRSRLQNDPEICELLEFRGKDRRKDVQTVQIERSGDLDIIGSMDSTEQAAEGKDLPEVKPRRGRKPKVPKSAVSSAELDESPVRIPVIDLEGAELDREELKAAKKPELPAGEPALPAGSAEKESVRPDYHLLMLDIGREIAEFEEKEAEAAACGKELEERMVNIQKLYEAADALNIAGEDYFVMFRGTQKSVMEQMQSNGKAQEKISRRLPVLRRILADFEELERLDA